ncbi:MAG: hypothetical protein JO156_13190 [Solirubrobacterales bacterium]|nr:hypothetical protein [Solirubrobacterales bacterium]
MNANVRNLLIVLAIAALVALVPGGGTGANVALQAASVAFLAALAWFASILYRQHRLELDSLGDRRRAALYISLGVATVTLTATPRLWHTSAGSVAWLVLMGAAVYTVVAVVWSARRY